VDVGPPTLPPLRARRLPSAPRPAAVAARPRAKAPLAAGSHNVQIVHPEYQTLRRRVTVLPGETIRLVVDLAEEAIRKKK
jgi:hypothetical protein